MSIEVGFNQGHFAGIDLETNTIRMCIPDYLIEDEIVRYTNYANYPYQRREVELYKLVHQIVTHEYIHKTLNDVFDKKISRQYDNLKEEILKLIEMI